jgi:hypothetical protein
MPVLLLLTGVVPVPAIDHNYTALGVLRRGVRRRSMGEIVKCLTIFVPVAILAREPWTAHKEDDEPTHDI